MRTAARPFLFVGCVELRQTLDMHALAGRASADASAIYLHAVEARARSGRGAGDFAEWLRGALELPALAERFERIDPYLTTLERVRGRLLSLVDRALEEERG